VLRAERDELGRLQVRMLPNEVRLVRPLRRAPFYAFRLAGLVLTRVWPLGDTEAVSLGITSVGAIAWIDRRGKIGAFTSGPQPSVASAGVVESDEHGEGNP
jgi:hypothetical protein